MYLPFLFFLTTANIAISIVAINLMILCLCHLFQDKLFVRGKSSPQSDFVLCVYVLHEYVCACIVWTVIAASALVIWSGIWLQNPLNQSKSCGIFFQSWIGSKHSVLTKGQHRRVLHRQQCTEYLPFSLFIPCLAEGSSINFMSLFCVLVFFFTFCFYS